MSPSSESESTIYRPGPPSGPRETESRAWLGLALVTALGAILRIIWLNMVDTQPVTDFHWYFERAAEMAKNMGYQVDGQFTAYWPVGYPGALSLLFRITGPNVWAAKIFQLCWTTACIPLTFWIAQRLFRSHLTAFIAALIVAIHPSFIAYTGILASEPLFTGLSLWGSLVLLKARDDRRKLLWGGVLFGLAALVRPQAIVVPLIVLAAAWFIDDKPVRSFAFWRAAGLTMVAAIAVMSPWLVRCWVVFGEPVFVSTNGGDNLLIGANEKAEGRYRNPDDSGLVRASSMTETERDKAARAAGKDWLLHNKRRWLKLAAPKLENTFWYATDAPYWAFQKQFGVLTAPGLGADKPLYKTSQSVAQGFQNLLMTLLLIGTAGLFLLKIGPKPRVPVPALPFLMIGFVGALSVVFFGNPRFGFPAAPFIAMIPAHLPTAVIHRLRQLGRPKGAEAEATAES